MARPTNTCDRCGRYAIGADARRLAILVNGGVSVERKLCLRCLDHVLDALTVACRKVTG